MCRALTSPSSGWLLPSRERTFIPGWSWYVPAKVLLNRVIQTPIGYHYADQPAESVDQVRNVVFNNFDISGCQLIFIPTGTDDHIYKLLLASPATMIKLLWPQYSFSTFLVFTQVCHAH